MYCDLVLLPTLTNLREAKEVAVGRLMLLFSRR
jgi:hypothetical protein